MKKTIILLLFCVVCLVIGLCFNGSFGETTVSSRTPVPVDHFESGRQSVPKGVRKPQTEFSCEWQIRPVKKPAALPKSILALLQRTQRIKDVRECLIDNDELNQKQDLSVWLAEHLAASEIDLNGDGRPDLVVLPNNKTSLCLIGANIGPFWVFEQTPEGYRMVLETDGHDLKILSTKGNGYLQIQAIGLSAVGVFTTTYSFQGNSYQETSTSQKEIH